MEFSGTILPTSKVHGGGEKRLTTLLLDQPLIRVIQPDEWFWKVKNLLDAAPNPSHHHHHFGCQCLMLHLLSY